MQLEDNQAAIILDASDDGEITVNVEAPNLNGLAGSLCQAIARKLMNDENFQAEIMDMLETDG